MLVPTYILVGLALGFVLHRWPRILGLAIVISSVVFGLVIAASVDAHIIGASLAALPSHTLGAVVGWLVRDALVTKKARSNHRPAGS